MSFDRWALRWGFLTAAILMMVAVAFIGLSVVLTLQAINTHDTRSRAREGQYCLMTADRWPDLDQCITPTGGR